MLVFGDSSINETARRDLVEGKVFHQVGLETMQKGQACLLQYRLMDKESAGLAPACGGGKEQ